MADRGKTNGQFLTLCNLLLKNLLSWLILSRLKEARERSEAEWSEEAEGQRRAHLELRNRLDIALRDLDEKSAQLSEVRDEVAQLRSSRYKRDSEVSQLQVQLRQREAELSALQLEKQMVRASHSIINGFMAVLPEPIKNTGLL